MITNKPLNQDLWYSKPITSELKKQTTFCFSQDGPDYNIEYDSGERVPIKIENFQKWIEHQSQFISHPNQKENFRRNIEAIIFQCVENHAMVQEIVKFAQEAKDLKDKSSHLWECISRTPDEVDSDEAEKGYIYRFRLKDEYNTNTDDLSKNATNRKNVRHKINEIFPAIEKNFFNADFIKLEKFGFKHETGEQGIFIELPDHKALTNQLKINGLEFVRIGLTKGIADDRSYIEAHRNNDTIFSFNQEFFHDATIHVMPTIFRALQSQSAFEEARNSMVSLISEKMTIIDQAQALVDNNVLGLDEESVALIQKHLDKMILTLSYLIDVRTSETSNINLTDKAFKRQYEDIWSLKNRLSDYLIKRFSPEIKDQLSSILSLPEAIDSLVPIDAGYKQWKKFAHNALEIEEDDIQKIVKICKSKISLFIDHFDVFSQNPKEWAIEFEKSNNPSYFCEKARALQDMQLKPDQIRKITNHERFRAIYEKYTERYDLNTMIHFSREEQRIVDFLLISNRTDDEIKMFLKNCNYPYFLDFSQEFQTKPESNELKSVISKTKNIGSFIQIAKTLKKLDLTPRQILKIQLRCKNNADWFSQAYIALNEAYSPEELAIFISDLSDPKTFIGIAEILKEKKLTMQEIHAIQLDCGKNTKGFEAAYNISKEKIEVREIALDLSEFEDTESFIAAVKLFKGSGLGIEKIKEFLTMCGKNVKSFIENCNIFFESPPSYSDLLKILSQSNEGKFSTNLLNFRNFQMFPNEILSIKKRCPDFFQIYHFFSIKPSIEELISAINDESNDINILKKLTKLMWRHLTLNHMCKIQVECAKHGNEFIDDLIVSSRTFCFFNPPAYQDVIDALVLSPDRQQYISLVGKLRIYDLYPSEILEIQNNPQTNNKDFIKAFCTFIKAPIIQDLIEALAQSSDKQAFIQIAKILRPYRFQPHEILKIQKICGKNANQFPHVFQEFNMPPPVELASVLGKLTDYQQIEKFIQVAKNNKQKNLSPQRLLLLA